MKHYITSIFIAAFSTIMAVPVMAEGCDLAVGVVCKSDNTDVPDAVCTNLKKRVESMLGANGLVAVNSDAPFVVRASFVDVASDVLPGPPRQYTVSTTLMMQLCDAASGTVLSTFTLDGVKGVGNSSQKAFSNALRPLNAQNPRCKDFMEGASHTILDYYNSHYPSLIERAKSLAMRSEYQQALYWLFSIPECCEGYVQATELAGGIYQDFINSEGSSAYQAARAAWVANPTAEGASKALPVLLTIPQGSEAWSLAESLVDEIYATVKDDKNFETRTKYEDATHLEELKLEAAREVGKSWGEGQKSSTTNLLVK